MSVFTWSPEPSSSHGGRVAWRGLSGASDVQGSWLIGLREVFIIYFYFTYLFIIYYIADLCMQ